MRHWWFSTKFATGYVCSNENNVIIETCPIWRRFMGQHIKNLADWLRSKGGFKYHEFKGAC